MSHEESTQLQTLFAKVWSSHAVAPAAEGEWLIAIDLHLLTEVTSPQAFEGLRKAGRVVPHPERTLAVADHNVPTTSRLLPIQDEASRQQVEALENNAAEFGIPYIPLTSRAQGIVHVIGPELGLTLPGNVIACGDSHTSTHGAFGALAFGIGTTEAEHILATQTLAQKPARTMLVQIDGDLGTGVTAKDLALAIVRRIGTAGATGHVIEYAGGTVRALDMAGRMTLCNLSIEMGARAGMIAPDETTFDYLRGRPFAPKDQAFAAAVTLWRSLASDPGATYDRTLIIDAADVVPMATWGTSPEDSIALSEVIPEPSDEPDGARAAQLRRSLDYMALSPGQRLEDVPIDVVFIGSCTNGRIEDLREAASIVTGRSVAPGVRALVVPGSGQVKAQAEAEGLDRLFVKAGFEWREAGCSMCVGMNPDSLKPGQRCASTSNRNFQDRQGRGGRTHLVSPSLAAAAAVTGRLTDPRRLSRADP